MKQLAVCILLGISLACSHTGARAQQNRLDSLFNQSDSAAVMDSLLRDFGMFMDSLARPSSFFSVSAGIGTGYFSFENKNSVYLTSARKLIICPSVGYFHRSGLGLAATGFALMDGKNTSLYQFAINPSYDFLGNKHVGFGVSFTKYFSKDSLSFYTTPIQQEVFAYVAWKKWKLRPTLSVSYGWGSAKDYEEKQVFLWNRWLQRSRRGYVRVENEESVHDLAATFSLRYNFSWYGLVTKDDGFLLTPVVMLTGGTQRFGFNTSYQSTSPGLRSNFLPSNQQVTEQTGFGAQSVSLILRSDYSVGKVFFMPQVLFDYYLPEGEDRFNVAYSVVVGVNL